MLTIDADAHVLETEHTWDFLDPDDRKHRPQLVVIVKIVDANPRALYGL